MNCLGLLFVLFSVSFVCVLSFRTTPQFKVTSVKNNLELNKLKLSAVKGKEEPPNDYWQGEWVCFDNCF